VPRTEDGLEPGCVYCGFWGFCGFEPWLLARPVVGFDVSLAGAIGVVHIMTGELGHMVHVFSVMVKPEGQPVRRL
jgi:hypothetical protein